MDSRINSTNLLYRDLSDLVPDRGLFTSTPVLNSDIFYQIRAKKAGWIRGDIKGFTENGVRFSHRVKGVLKRWAWPRGRNTRRYGDNGNQISVTEHYIRATIGI